MLNTVCARFLPIAGIGLAANLFGQTTAGRTDASTTTPSGRETLVAEASIGAYVFLPVVIHGHAATVVLDVGADQGEMSQAGMTRLGVSVTGALDSLTFGKTVVNVVHQIPMTDQDQGFETPPGMAPVVGLLGADLLSHYDLVFDGPAQRMRMYKAPTDAASARTAWLPSGITRDDCVPLEPDPHYPDRVFFPLTGNGHTIHSMFDSGSGSTNINLAAARVLGITKRTSSVYLTLPGYEGGFSMYVGQKIWKLPAGIRLTIGPYALSSVPIVIFQHLPRETGPDDPELSVGLEAVQDRLLFVSYSTHRVCLGKPSATPTHPAVPSAKVADIGDTTQVLLTTEALTNMTTFWTTWLQEPLAVQDTGRRQHQKRQLLTLASGHSPPLFRLDKIVDMNAMAVHYPSVAADLQHAHLTAQQWERYRTALFIARVTDQVLTLQGDTIPVPMSLAGKNIVFLRAQPQALEALIASGMYFPNLKAGKDFGGDLDP